MRKQDIARITNPADLDRRYNFAKSKREIQQSQNDIKYNFEEIKKDSKKIENIETKIEENTKNIKQNSDIIENHSKLIEQNKNDIESNEKEIELNTEARHTHNNTTTLEKITEENYNELLENKHKHENKEILDKIEGIEELDLEKIKNENMTILSGSCISKNKRVVLNVSADISILAGTEITLFDLSVMPSQAVKFLIYSDSEIAVAELSIDGSIKTVFNNDVSNIFFNLIFDY